MQTDDFIENSVTMTHMLNVHVISAIMAPNKET
jgi:hypothetical protein